MMPPGSRRRHGQRAGGFALGGRQARTEHHAEQAQHEDRGRETEAQQDRERLAHQHRAGNAEGEAGQKQRLLRAHVLRRDDRIVGAHFLGHGGFDDPAGLDRFHYGGC